MRHKEDRKLRQGGKISNAFFTSQLRPYYLYCSYIREYFERSIIANTNFYCLAWGWLCLDRQVFRRHFWLYLDFVYLPRKITDILFLVLLS
jgi:hypothetical protein